mmetsp:Transcript_3589/g.4743  ORF Transcript_3589/g.4743 Transcript_3589/m.4743 type:complete len:220 (+) Transcript_3589:146-805(+)
MVVPHTLIPISSIRSNDILLLLILGTVTELIARVILHKVKAVPRSLKVILQELKSMREEANGLRKIGTSTFVETSKLERKILTLEKKVKDMEADRADKVKTVKYYLKRFTIVTTALIFLTYYGTPLLTVDGLRVPFVNPDLVSKIDVSTIQDDAVDVAHASALMKGVMFPLSYVGMGMKASKVGLGDIKHCSIGALVVFWSAQVMTGRVFECLEALSFR